jgi:uncharacterized protein (DUF1499 family)/uncharacterized membrane protein (DUF485 family)
MARAILFAGKLGFWLAIVAAILAIASPIGYRLGWWGVPVALRELIKWAMILGITAFVLCVIALIFSRAGNNTAPRTGRAVAGLILSALFAGYPLYQYSRVQSLPYIHDITTDTDKPPVFVALAEARKAAPNGIEYQGAEIAAQQKQAYADLAPLDSKLPPAELFAKAEAAARAFGWDIAGAQPSEGRIEATAVSLIYAFKDDIVVRIVAREGGSRLDMRSMSRVGRSDVGVNAARIRAYFERLKASGA